jgi:hypothetical protein
MNTHPVQSAGCGVWLDGLCIYQVSKVPFAVDFNSLGPS